MNREETEQAIKVMQAWLDGKEIEIKPRTKYSSSIEWLRTGVPIWDWANYEYRIKPEKVKGWINMYADGCCGVIYPTKESAKKTVRSHPAYIRTVYIEEASPD